MGGRLLAKQEGMHPGNPGRGYDPTANYSDVQWFMYHQRNAAHFGAYSTRTYDIPALIAFARKIMEAAPQLRQSRNGTAYSDETLARICTIETVDTLEGCPDRATVGAPEVWDDPALPMLRLRVMQLSGRADERGRRSFVFAQAAHSMMEGADTARLVRSRPSGRHSNRPVVRPMRRSLRLLAEVTAPIFAFSHIILARLLRPHPGPVHLGSRTVPHHVISMLARTLGVSRRALLFALVARVLAEANAPARSRRRAAAYTTLAPAVGAPADAFMRMHLVYTTLKDQPDFGSFARSIDETLRRGEAGETGLQAAHKAAALASLRWMARVAPFAFSSRVFEFWPFGMVFSLLTPHQLAGALGAGLMEPIHCGVVIPGVNGCIVVPGREWVTFNFYVEQGLLGRLDSLEPLLRTLTCGGAAAGGASSGAGASNEQPAL